jgi:hypothetical protein
MDRESFKLIKPRGKMFLSNYHKTFERQAPTIALSFHFW